MSINNYGDSWNRDISPDAFQDTDLQGSTTFGNLNYGQGMSEGYGNAFGNMNFGHEQNPITGPTTFAAQPDAGMWSSMKNFFTGSTDANGVRTPGMAGSVFKGIGSVMQGLAGLANAKIAKKSLKHNIANSKANYAAQQQLTNNRISRRAISDYARYNDVLANNNSAQNAGADAVAARGIKDYGV